MSGGGFEPLTLDCQSSRVLSPLHHQSILFNRKNEIRSTVNEYSEHFLKIGPEIYASSAFFVMPFRNIVRKITKIKSAVWKWYNKENKFVPGNNQQTSRRWRTTFFYRHSPNIKHSLSSSHSNLYHRKLSSFRESITKVSLA